jgi:CheY-like chemotaxis protein
MLHAWQPEKPDLIFVDLNMPRMGGKTLIQQIKKHEQFKTIPVAVYTTSSRKEERDELLKMGVDWFITKPNTLAELRVTISLVITEDVPLS